MSTITQIPNSDLPSPLDRSAAAVVIYDGKCKFCTNSVRKLDAWDKDNKLAFVSLHDSFVTKNYPELSHDELMKQIYVVTPDGDYLAGVSGLRYALRLLPRLRLVAPILYIPFSLPLWQWMYMRIANRRYRLANREGEQCEGTCSLHFKNESE